MPKEKLIFVWVRDMLFLALLFNTCVGYIAFTFQKELQSGSIILVIIMTCLFFLSFLLALLCLITMLNHDISNKLRNNKWFKKTFPIINLFMLFCCTIFCASLCAIYILGLINRNKTINNNTVLPLLLSYAMFLGSYYLYKKASKIYENKYYKILSLKTKNGRDFKDLYLYSYNEEYIFLGSLPNHIGSREYLVVRKDDVDLFHLKLERFFWDEIID